MNPTDAPEQAQPSTTVTSGSFVPPRPNLGPEPLADSSIAWIWWTVPAVGLIGMLVWQRMIRRRKRRGEKAHIDIRTTSHADPDTPAAALVALSATVREKLAGRFGEGWRAKTTEEIAVDPKAREAFSLETLGRIVQLLREADRVKFARADGSESFYVPQRLDLAAWSLWVSEFDPAAGASSMKTGK